MTIKFRNFFITICSFRHLTYPTVAIQIDLLYFYTQMFNLYFYDLYGSTTNYSVHGTYLFGVPAYVDNDILDNTPLLFGARPRMN